MMDNYLKAIPLGNLERLRYQSKKMLEEGITPLIKSIEKATDKDMSLPISHFNDLKQKSYSSYWRNR